MPAPIIQPFVTGGVGPTLLEYREALGEELGYWGAYTVSAAASGTPDAQRLALLAELEDDEEDDGRLIGAYLYVRTGASAGDQRRIVRRGYQGEIGSLAVSRPFTATLSQGDVVEVSLPLPVQRHLDRKGLNDLVEEALERIPVLSWLTLTGNGTMTQTLPYGWLTYEQTRGIYDLVNLPTSAVPLLSTARYQIKNDGAQTSLLTDYIYSSTTTFWLVLALQADRLVYDGTAWAITTSPGLGGDAWQAAARVHHVRTFGMVKALQHLMTITLRDKAIDDKSRQLAMADYQRRLTQYAYAAKWLISHEFPEQIQERKETTMYGYGLSWPNAGGNPTGAMWPSA